MISPPAILRLLQLLSVYFVLEGRKPWIIHLATFQPAFVQSLSTDWQVMLDVPNQDPFLVLHDWLHFVRRT
jgi:hypothetical protein